jgi:hypothetical protein
VADRVDVRHRGAVVIDDLDPAAGVGLQTRGGQVERSGHSLPARGVHDGVGGNPLAAAQRGDRAVALGLHRVHDLAEPERHGQVAQVEFERLDHLEVAELQHPVPLLDHGHLAAQRGEHGRVLDADDTRARDHHGPRDLLEVLDAVRVDDRLLVERDTGRPGGLGPGRDDHRVRGDLPLPARAVVHRDLVRAEEGRGAAEHRDPVAGQLAADHVVLAGDHVPGPVGQVADGDLVLDPVALPVHLPLVEAGQVQDRLAHGLGRDGAGVDADPAEHVRPLDNRHPAFQLGRGDGRFLAAGAGPDDEKIEVVHASSVRALSRDEKAAPRQTRKLSMITAGQPVPGWLRVGGCFLRHQVRGRRRAGAARASRRGR